MHNNIIKNIKFLSVSDLNWSIIMEYVNYYCIKQLFYTVMYFMMMDQ